MWIVSIVGSGWWVYGAGQAAQSKTDQTAFDKVNAGLTAQARQANKLIQDAQANIEALATERDALKTKLEIDHANYQTSNDALRSKYSAISLRFAAAKDSGGRVSCGDAMPGNANAPSDAGTPYCIVSTEVDAALKTIAYDCDSLRGDYTLLYEWAHAVR